MLDLTLGEQGEVIMSGRFDASQAQKAEAFLSSVPSPEIIDLAKLEYISSAGLGTLLQTQKRLQATGKKLILINVSKHVRDIFHYSGFDQIFEIRG